MGFAARILSVSLLVTLTPMAQAQGPADLGMTRGMLTAGGRLLFVSDLPADAPCKKTCRAIPLLAAPNAVTDGLWTLTATPRGTQWAYDGQPLFVWPEVSDNAGRYYFGYEYLLDDYGPRPAAIKDPVAEGFAVALSSSTISSKPRIESRNVVNYGLRNDTADTGKVEATVCVDKRGNSGPVTLALSSGSSGLDKLAIEFATKIEYVPAKAADGAPIAVCGYVVVVDWPESSIDRRFAHPPPAAQVP